MTRPCECGLASRPRRLFGFLAEPVDGAPCFFTGSIAPGGCGLPSTDSLSGFVSAGNGKIQGGVNADVFIEFLKRLLTGATRTIFLIVDRGPAHRAKKTKAFVETLSGRLKLFFLPPYFPDRNPDELVWKHLKADTTGRMAVTDKADFKGKAVSSMRGLQRSPDKICSFFHKPSLDRTATP